MKATGWSNSVMMTGLVFQWLCTMEGEDESVNQSIGIINQYKQKSAKI